MEREFLSIFLFTLLYGVINLILKQKAREKKVAAARRISYTYNIYVKSNRETFINFGIKIVIKGGTHTYATTFESNQL